MTDNRKTTNEELCTKYDGWRRFFTQDEISDTKLQTLVLMHEKHSDGNAKATLRKMAEEKLACICNQESEVKSCGDVEIIIDYKDGTQEKHDIRNTILRNGKIALAKCLTNDVEDPYDFYIDYMIFGTNGATGGTPKYIDASRSGLFGTTLLTKNVISSLDEAAPTTAILTSVITFDEGNGNTLNEMALRMKNDQLYSMITFPDLNKDSTMQLTINWSISLL